MELAHLRTQICILVSCISISYDAVCMICIKNSDFFKNFTMMSLYFYLGAFFLCRKNLINLQVAYTTNSYEVLKQKSQYDSGALMGRLVSVILTFF